MDDLRLYVLFNSSPVISGRCEFDNERLCAMEPLSHLKRFPPSMGLGPLEQKASAQPTELPGIRCHTVQPAEVMTDVNRDGRCLKVKADFE